MKSINHTKDFLFNVVLSIRKGINKKDDSNVTLNIIIYYTISKHYMVGRNVLLSQET